MNTLQAILMGAVQGISEFLPISSSGHLVLLSKLMHINTPPILLDVSLHVGTLVAIILVFYKELYHLMRHVRDPLWLLLIAGTLPTVFIALIFRNIFEKAFQTGKTLGIEFMITGIVLLLSEARNKTVYDKQKSMGIWQAILIGCAQGAAILPALSRSGLTMAAALGLGIERKDAVKFTFLLSIPAILGAVVFTFSDIPKIPVHMDLPMFLATVTSAVFGYMSIRFLLGWVSRHSLKPFGYYTLLLGSGLVINQWVFHIL